MLPCRTDHCKVWFLHVYYYYYYYYYFLQQGTAQTLRFSILSIVLSFYSPFCSLTNKRPAETISRPIYYSNSLLQTFGILRIGLCQTVKTKLFLLQTEEIVTKLSQVATETSLPVAQFLLFYFI